MRKPFLAYRLYKTVHGLAFACGQQFDDPFFKEISCILEAQSVPHQRANFQEEENNRSRRRVISS